MLHSSETNTIDVNGEPHNTLHPLVLILQIPIPLLLFPSISRVVVPFDLTSMFFYFHSSIGGLPSYYLYLKIWHYY